MSYRIPYNLLPNLGTLQEDDIVPGLRPAFEEGSMTVGDLKSYITPAKVYRADLSQDGTNDPVIDFIYENTIGDIVWTYGTVGTYIGTLTGAFTGNVPTLSKIFFSSGSNSAYYKLYKNSLDVIKLIVYDNTFTESDDLLKTTFIEILYYSAAL